MEKVIKKNNINILFEYMLMFFLIISFRTMYISTEEYMNLRKIVNVSFIIILVINILLSLKNKKSLENSVKTLIVYYIYIFFFSFLNFLKFGKDATFYLYFGLIFPLFIIYYYQKDKDSIEELLKKFKNIILVLAVISLVIYIIGPLTNIVQPTGTLYSFWSNTQVKSYWNLHFLTQYSDEFGIIINKNTSIFTEAPMYSLLLTIALLIETLLENNTNKKKEWIFIITIITTLSITGIISICLIYFLKYMFLTKNNSFKILLIPLVIFVIVFIIWQIMMRKMNTYSYSKRFTDIIVCLKTWLSNPILGSGFTNESVQISFDGMNGAFSNSFFSVLAKGGIYFSVIYILPWIRLLKCAIKYDNKKILIMLIIFMFLFSITLFYYTFLIFKFLAISYILPYFIEKNNKERIY